MHKRIALVIVLILIFWKVGFSQESKNEENRRLININTYIGASYTVYLFTDKTPNYINNNLKYDEYKVKGDALSFPAAISVSYLMDNSIIGLGYNYHQFAFDSLNVIDGLPVSKVYIGKDNPFKYNSIFATYGHKIKSTYSYDMFINAGLGYNWINKTFIDYKNQFLGEIGSVFLFNSNKKVSLFINPSIVLKHNTFLQSSITNVISFQANTGITYNLFDF